MFEGRSLVAAQVRGIVFAASAVAFCGAASAESYVWVGTGTNNWTTLSCWQKEGGAAATELPGADDDVSLPAPNEGGCGVFADAAIDVHSLTIGSKTASGGTMTFESRTLETHRIGAGGLVVRAGGAMTHTPLPTSAKTIAEERYKLNVSVAGDVTITADGKIDVTGCGYFGSRTPAFIQGPGAINTGNGATSYAAHGGAHFIGHSYGSLSSPTNCGSSNLSSGGGAVHLAAIGTVTLNGTIGSDALPSSYYGGGAGGSVWITCAKLMGSGSVSASGVPSVHGVTGCGGRIAVWQSEATDFSDWTGKLMATGGSAGTVGRGSGAAGTVYLQAKDETVTNATIIVDNKNYTRSSDASVGSFAELRADLGSSVVGTLVVTNNGGVAIKSGETAEVYGSISTVGGAASWSGGTVRLMGSAPATVSGSSPYCNFICEEPGKTIYFGTTAKDCFEIAAGHTLTLRGTDESKINLRPAGDATVSWAMKLDAGATADITYVSVLNSDASGGDLAVTAYFSENLGGNQKWAFTTPVVPGEVNSWTGAANTDWNEPRNWSRGRSVADTDDVVIPAKDGNGEAITNMPAIVAGTLLLNKLTVEEKATLTLDGVGVVVTVSNRLAVAGTLAAAGKERIVCTKDVDITGGKFTAGGSTFVLEGSGDQLVDLGEQAFANLLIDKPTGTVTFASGFKASVFDVASDDALSLVFAAGKTVEAETCFMRGWRSDGGQAIALASAMSPTRWKLKVGSCQSVVGVKVSDSDASEGAWVTADATSSNESNNVHWDFGADGRKNAMWIGGASGGFATASNWSSHAVPDTNTCVVIFARDGETNTVTASAAIAVGELRLEAEGTGCAVFESQTAAAHEIVGDVIVGAGCKMTHNYIYTMTTRLNLAVGGSVTIAAGGAVDVSGRGYSAGNGPGYRSPSAAQANAAYGGGHVVGQSYGSISEPTDYGSGYGSTGGGIVKIAAGGTVTVAGTIRSGSDDYSGYASGAGGSIWITCSNLLGGGTIDATAGSVTYGSAGSGGRIAVWLTEAKDFGDWHGSMQALGGDWNGGGAGIGTASAGTIYLQAAGQDISAATVIADNGNRKQAGNVGFVELGAPVSRKKYIGNLVVTNGAHVRLVADSTVGELDLASSNVELNLGTNTLLVISSVHKKGRGWADGAKVVCETNEVTGAYGKIVWKKQGMLLFVK